MLWLALVVGCPAPEPTPDAIGIVSGTHTHDDLTAPWTAYAPDFEGPKGVAVLLPGDTWPGDDLPNEAPLQDWAEDHGVIIVSADPPNGGDCWWTPNKHARAAWVVDLLETEVFTNWDVDFERVHLGGWSGGAFLAFGAPFYAEMSFSGGLVGVCGADIPRQDTDDDFCGFDDLDDPPLDVADPSAVAAGRRVFVSRNSDDELVEAIDAGADYWEDAGADVQRIDAGTGGHCAMDVTQHLIDGLTWVEAR